MKKTAAAVSLLVIRQRLQTNCVRSLTHSAPVPSSRKRNFSRQGMAERPLVQWSFFQYKHQKSKKNSSGSAPSPCYLHSATQVGSKFVIYGGCGSSDEHLNQLFLYDSVKFAWSVPVDDSQYQEDHLGKRYAHSATLVEMHPPKIMFYGGMVSAGTYEFDTPSSAVDDHITSDDPMLNSSDIFDKAFMSLRRQGKKAELVEETDEAVYFLSLTAEKWVWSKPLVHGSRQQKPSGRAAHSACKIGSNEVAVFGGWSERPLNDLWSFNFVDMEWHQLSTQGVTPQPRYRHTAEFLAGKLYIFGGSDNARDVADGSAYLALHELAMDTLTWTSPQLRGVNPFPRSGHCTAVVGARSVAVFGGKRSNEVFLNDFVIIDLESYSTTLVNAVESHLPIPIGNATLTSIGNKSFVFGGVDAKGCSYNDIRLLDLSYYLDKNDITVREGAMSDYSFKILIIGDASVGKSAILTRFAEGAFLDNYTSTIGIDFSSKMIRVDRAICKLEIWDTAGQERFSTITANYYRGAQGALLVYDVGQEESFQHVRKWHERAVQLGGQDLVCLLIGNKSDLSDSLRRVSTQEGSELAVQLGVPFVETSALQGTNVEAAFVQMTGAIKKSVDRRGLSGVKGGITRTGSVSIAKSERKRGSPCGCS